MPASTPSSIQLRRRPGVQLVPTANAIFHAACTPIGPRRRWHRTLIWLQRRIEDGTRPPPGGERGGGERWKIYLDLTPGPHRCPGTGACGPQPGRCYPPARIYSVADMFNRSQFSRRGDMFVTGHYPTWQAPIQDARHCAHNFRRPPGSSEWTRSCLWGNINEWNY